MQKNAAHVGKLGCLLLKSWDSFLVEVIKVGSKFVAFYIWFAKK